MIEHPVKLVTGVLFPDEERLSWVREHLCKIWGDEERISRSWDFDKTDYYKDISPSLKRCFISYKGLRCASDIVEWKLAAIRIESLSADYRPRTINIDPGYIDGARLALASTKDHAHRVYIRDGIHAEITLRYQSKKWKPFDCTFPDFASGMYDEFLSQVRDDWMRERQ